MVNTKEFNPLKDVCSKANVLVGPLCDTNARISFTRFKRMLGWVVACKIVCEKHAAQLVHTLSSLTAEHTNSSVVG
jgi:hypothetical protein